MRSLFYHGNEITFLSWYVLLADLVLQNNLLAEIEFETILRPETRASWGRETKCFLGFCFVFFWFFLGFVWFLFRWRVT